MTQETVRPWQVAKAFVDILDKGRLSDEERLFALTAFVDGLRTGQDQTPDLTDDEVRLEAQGFDDWLRTDPGRRLTALEARLEDRFDDHEERLGRLEDWVAGTVYPNRKGADRQPLKDFAAAPPPAGA